MAALHVSFFPSGLFPGGEVDGWRWSMCNGGDQRDLIAFVFSAFKVLCDYFQDSDVFLLSLRSCL
jgi:hypothetical protein